MSWAGSEAPQVYLGQNRVGVWSPTAADAAVQWLDSASPEEGWSRAVETLKGDDKPKARKVAVWLSGALARPFVFQPVQGLRRRSEALTVAAGLAPEATGLQGPCEVWLDGWTAGKPCVAVAVDRALREQIESTARAEKLRLTSLRPWWVAALNAALDETAAIRLLAVEEVDALTVLSGEPGSIAAATCYAPSPDASQSQALLTRTLMAANVSAEYARRAHLQAGDMLPFDVRCEQLA